jgi:predicted lipoprotein
LRVVGGVARRRRRLSKRSVAVRNRIPQFRRQRHECRYATEAWRSRKAENRLARALHAVDALESARAVHEKLSDDRQAIGSRALAVSRDYGGLLAEE